MFNWGGLTSRKSYTKYSDVSEVSTPNPGSPQSPGEWYTGSASPKPGSYLQPPSSARNGAPDSPSTTASTGSVNSREDAENLGLSTEKMRVLKKTLFHFSRLYTDVSDYDLFAVSWDVYNVPRPPDDLTAMLPPDTWDEPDIVALGLRNVLPEAIRYWTETCDASIKNYRADYQALILPNGLSFLYEGGCLLTIYARESVLRFVHSVAIATLKASAPTVAVRFAVHQAPVCLVNSLPRVPSPDLGTLGFEWSAEEPQLLASSADRPATEGNQIVAQAETDPRVYHQSRLVKASLLRQQFANISTRLKFDSGGRVTRIGDYPIVVFFGCKDSESVVCEEEDDSLLAAYESVTGTRDRSSARRLSADEEVALAAGESMLAQKLSSDSLQSFKPPSEDETGPDTAGNQRSKHGDGDGSEGRREGGLKDDESGSVAEAALDDLFPIMRRLKALDLRFKPSVSGQSGVRRFKGSMDVVKAGVMRLVMEVSDVAAQAQARESEEGVIPSDRVINQTATPEVLMLRFGVPSVDAARLRELYRSVWRSLKFRAARSAIELHPPVVQLPKPIKPHRKCNIYFKICNPNRVPAAFTILCLSDSGKTVLPVAKHSILHQSRAGQSQGASPSLFTSSTRGYTDQSGIPIEWKDFPGSSPQSSYQGTQLGTRMGPSSALQTGKQTLSSIASDLQKRLGMLTARTKKTSSKTLRKLSSTRQQSTISSGRKNSSDGEISEISKRVSRVSSKTGGRPPLPGASGASTNKTRHSNGVLSKYGNDVIKSTTKWWKGKKSQDLDDGGSAASNQQDAVSVSTVALEANAHESASLEAVSADGEEESPTDQLNQPSQKVLVETTRRRSVGLGEQHSREPEDGADSSKSSVDFESLPARKKIGSEKPEFRLDLSAAVSVRETEDALLDVDPVTGFRATGWRTSRPNVYGSPGEESHLSKSPVSPQAPPYPGVAADAAGGPTETATASAAVAGRDDENSNNSNNNNNNNSKEGEGEWDESRTGESLAHASAPTSDRRASAAENLQQMTNCHNPSGVSPGSRKSRKGEDLSLKNFDLSKWMLVEPAEGVVLGGNEVEVCVTVDVGEGVASPIEVPAALLAIRLDEQEFDTFFCLVGSISPSFYGLTIHQLEKLGFSRITCVEGSPELLLPAEAERLKEERRAQRRSSRAIRRASMIPVDSKVEPQAKADAQHFLPGKAESSSTDESKRQSLLDTQVSGATAESPNKLPSGRAKLPMPKELWWLLTYIYVSALKVQLAQNKQLTNARGEVVNPASVEVTDIDTPALLPVLKDWEAGDDTPPPFSLPQFLLSCARGFEKLEAGLKAESRRVCQMLERGVEIPSTTSITAALLVFERWALSLPVALVPREFLVDLRDDDSHVLCRAVILSLPSTLRNLLLCVLTILRHILAWDARSRRQVTVASLQRSIKQQREKDLADLQDKGKAKKFDEESNKRAFEAFDTMKKTVESDDLTIRFAFTEWLSRIMLRDTPTGLAHAFISHFLVSGDHV